MDLIRKYKLFYALINMGFVGNILIIYYLTRGFNYAQIGTATAVMTAGYVLFEVPTGVVADKISRKLSVLIGLIIHTLGLPVLILLNSYPLLILYSILNALGGTFASGSLQAWLYYNLKHLGREKEYRQLMKDIKTLTIPLSATTLIIGGFLAQYYGFTLPLILTLLAEITAIVVAYTIPEYEFKKPERSYLKHTLEASRKLLRPELLWLIILSIIVTMQVSQFRKFFEPYLGDILAKNLKTTLIGTLGILGVVEAIVKVIPRLIGIHLRDKWSVKAYSLAPLVIPLLTALSVVYQNPLWIITLGIVVTVVNTAFGFNVSIELQHRIPREERATIRSLDMMVSALVMSAFYFIYGFVVDWLGLAEARLLFALILLGAGVSLKAGELLGPLKDVLKLKHMEAMIK
ncbi:MFS transporter [Thermococcus sp.]|uniref:MFS transporter n=1 Tax=Thermococcus sp. TaxID=35749 RepID=UPI002625D6DC|nr:MFS transporter [Thermococcus sp.]